MLTPASGAVGEGDFIPVRERLGDGDFGAFVEDEFVDALVFGRTLDGHGGGDYDGLAVTVETVGGDNQEPNRDKEEKPSGDEHGEGTFPKTYAVGENHHHRRRTS